MTTALVRELSIDSLSLDSGSHNPNAPIGPKFCLLEAVAYIAGEKWTDRPACVSPLLGGYGRNLNDAMDYAARQRLKPFIYRLLGTGAGENPTGEDRSRVIAADHIRAYIAARHAFRHWLPMFLRVNFLSWLAVEIQGVSVIGPDSAKRMGALLHAMRDGAWGCSNEAGAAIDRARAVAHDLELLRMRQDSGFADLGRDLVLLYADTHDGRMPVDTWGESLELFEEMTQVGNSQ